jgi:CheY-like chemotaxis protein
VSWRVLVVDDEKNYCELLRRVLERDGYRVTATDDADKAVEHLCGGAVDLLVTDLHMPGLTGYDLVELARSLPRVPRILAITAQKSILEGSARRLREAHCLLKPFDMADFRAKVAFLTERWQHPENATAGSVAQLTPEPT